MDWKKIGLRCGLEIHQQLDTNKLFCNCPSRLREKEPDFTIKRKLRAVAGELGETDIAAAAEQIKNKSFIYEGYNDTTCLVELDEEPPHLINKDALRTAIQIGNLLNMKIFDELEVMRKTVIDGSNTAGFQRTALIAENGSIETKEGKIHVSTLAIEEDAARKIRENGNDITYRLDRLGIPLVEIMTEPDIHSPEQAKEAAEKIGLLMRMTKVKRGLGTVRQDVNVSITDGARVEIKGFQRLEDIPEIIKKEVERQQNLLEVSAKIKSRGANKAEKKFIDIARILSGSCSNLVKKALEAEQAIYAVKLPGLHTLLKKQISGEKTVAKDIVDYLKVFSNMKGFIHSDELPGYGLTENEVQQVRLRLDCKHEDAFAFLIGRVEECKHGLSLIAERAEQLMHGVPKEVRAANEDCTTRFLRPMPGAARMYPETDEPPFEITKKFLREIPTPERPEVKIARLKKAGLSDDLANQMIRSSELRTFESLLGKFKKISPNIIANIILSAESEIKRRYQTESSDLTEKHFEETFMLLEKDKTAKEALIDILAHLAKHPDKSAEAAMKELKLEKISVKELQEIIGKTIAENEQLTKDKQFGVLMGFVMRRVRGRIDGEVVSEELKKKLGI